MMMKDEALLMKLIVRDMLQQDDCRWIFAMKAAYSKFEVGGNFLGYKKSKNCEEVSEDDEAILMIMRFQRELEGQHQELLLHQHQDANQVLFYQGTLEA
ncbi:unnamed protein product [Vicia faba]|uniref:Uncharacterized protein n=1 Tax=Vicia faba TaxID=3906 RepID=A0AAV0Z748_VICFA|nr:unnamed protein product [Vicia faba]